MTKINRRNFLKTTGGAAAALAAVKMPAVAQAPAEVHILLPMPEKSSSSVYFVPSHWDLVHYQGGWWKKKEPEKAEPKSR